MKSKMGEKGCERCKEWQEHYYWEHMGVGKTKFFRFMTGDFQQRIRIPDKFASKFISQMQRSEGFDLKVPSGEMWHVGVSKVANDLFFSSGWGDFVNAHKLQENDLLVFTFSGNSFEVLIFEASGCEKLSSIFAGKMHKYFEEAVGQQVEQYSLSNNSDDDDDDSDRDDDDDSNDDNDTSVPSQLIESHRKVSTFKKFSGKSKPRKELPESPNSCSSCDVKHEAEEDESDDDTHADFNNYYYSRAVNRILNDDEKGEIIGLASVQPGNPAFLTVLQTSHLKRQNNLLVVPIEFAAEHLHMSLHEALLLRPNREDMWHVKYYQGRSSRGFGCQPWATFVRDNKLRVGDICIFELIKGGRKEKKAARAMLAVHVARRKKSNGRFALVG